FINDDPPILDHTSFPTRRSSDLGNQEDYVSMGMSGARRLEGVLKNLRNTIAIELLCACQGVDLLAPLKTGNLAMKAYEAVRSKSDRKRTRLNSSHVSISYADCCL